MPSRELQVVERPEVDRRQSRPCPGGNGTTIGTVQQFTVLCNTSIDGDVLDRLDAFDFTACVDLCSSFHPKCDGVSFDGSKCTLRANLRPDQQRPSRRIESAVGSFPGASSDCATQGGTRQAVGTSFNTMCGFIIAGNDLSQNFAPTFQDCLGQCASTTGCAGVSFDPSQNLGFKNCYLKTAVTNSSAVAADQRTDSAMVAAAAAAPDALPASSSPAAGSSPAGPGVSTIPVPSPAPASGGAVFFTPPAGASSSSTSAAAPPSASTLVSAPASSAPTATNLIITPSSSLATGSFPFLIPAPSTTPVSSAESAPEDVSGSPPSMAWVAAPVVGGVAAIALIAVSFVMLKRRRRGGSSRGSGSGKEKSISRSSPLSSLFTAWLPSWSSSSSSSSSSRHGNERRGSGRKMTGMGNFSEVESGQRRRSGEVATRGSVRSSVVGFVIGRPMGMERLEDIEEGEGAGARNEGVSAAGVNGRSGRVELRNSLNGLGQNKWSQ